MKQHDKNRPWIFLDGYSKHVKSEQETVWLGQRKNLHLFTLGCY